MQCVILAAGEGIRMRPLTLTAPKPMLKLNGKPILEYIFESLPDEITEVILVIGYLGDKIKGYFGDEFCGKKIKYVFQKEKSGTYKALELCKEYLDDDSFLMLYADDLHSPLNFKRCIDKKPLCVLLHNQANNPERFGVVLLNEDKTIKAIEEKPDKPKSNLVSCGPVCLDKRIFSYPPKPASNREYYLPESVSKLAKVFKINTAETDWWIPIGYPEDLKRAEEFLNGQAKNKSRRKQD